MAALIDQFERFWEPYTRVCACECPCPVLVGTPGERCEACEGGEHAPEPDACPEHRAGCGKAAH